MPQYRIMDSVLIQIMVDHKGLLLCCAFSCNCFFFFYNYCFAPLFCFSGKICHLFTIMSFPVMFMPFFPGFPYPIILPWIIVGQHCWLHFPMGNIIIAMLNLVICPRVVRNGNLVDALIWWIYSVSACNFIAFVYLQVLIKAYLFTMEGICSCSLMKSIFTTSS